MRGVKAHWVGSSHNCREQVISAALQNGSPGRDGLQDGDFPTIELGDAANFRIADQLDAMACLAPYQVHSLEQGLKARIGAVGIEGRQALNIHKEHIALLVGPVERRKHGIRFEFAYDDGGVGKGGTGTLYVNGKNVATGRIDQTQCCAFSADEGADVGADEGTPVTEAYQVPFKFTGKINSVTIELKEMTPSAANEAEKARKEAALKKALSD